MAAAASPLLSHPLRKVPPVDPIADAESGPDRLVEGLTDAQRAAVLSDGAPLVVLAGAGSGKTRVLTRRIAHRVRTGDADATHVLALTFTRKAAGELQSRLRELGLRDRVVAGTFHAVAYASLRRQWADAGATAPTLLERKVGLLASLLSPSASGDRPGAARDVATEIEWAKARLVAPEDYEHAAGQSGRRPVLGLGAVADLYQRYEREKRRRGLVDFDDLLVLAGRAMVDDAAFAARQRWRFRHVFVDEFQDVNPAQQSLLDLWVGGRRDLCVVGDPHQAIYAWNGADAGYLARLSDPSSGATVITLDDNFRSTPQILAVGHAVLASGDRRLAPMRPHQADGPVPSVRAFATDLDEAIGVARGLRDRRRPGQRWGGFAVLARTHAQLVVIEEALRRAGIPVRVRGGGFLRHPEVVQALDDLARRPGPLRAGLVDLANERDDPPADRPSGGSVDGERPALRAELVRLGQELIDLDPDATTEAFAPWLAATLSSGETTPTGDAVDLATFHAAKGLEWPTVFLTGLEHGLVPIGHARTDAQLDEERRLLYVAVTRARHELHCSWATTRTFGARTVAREPSAWLTDIDAARAALSEGANPDEIDWRARLAAERSRLAAAADRARGHGASRFTIGADADPVVLRALKDWRSQAARTAGVPAHVIFHDTTLAAVAQSLPHDRPALLSVPGLGPVKVERYGDDLLRLVAEHAS